MPAPILRAAANPVALLIVLLVVGNVTSIRVVQSHAAGPQAVSAVDYDSSDGNLDPVVSAAGDIACSPDDPNYNGGLGTATACRMKYTSNLLLNLSPLAVLTLGDNEQSDGALWKFEQSYDPTWGRVKSTIHPAVGNHEYGTPGASGYFTYFGGAAGDPSKGYYSFDIGTWHFIALNSNCDKVGGCGPGSPQEEWLKADLAASHAMCKIAYWHHPRFSSGGHGSNPAYDAWWQDLYGAGVDVVLNGHDHDYERFAPQSPSGVLDYRHGIRQFVVGTGGRSHSSFQSIQPNSEVRNSDTFGILKLTLHLVSYDWEFIPESGGSFTDSGTNACRAASVSFVQAASDMLNSPASSAYFIFPDSNTVHPKPPGVGYASVTDWTALGYVYGSLANMPQVTVLDTNGTYIDQATGAPKIRDSIIVLFGGTLVNEVVHYYEENRIAPLRWSLEPPRDWSSGTLFYRTRSGDVAVTMPIQTVGGGSADMVLLESFMDANGNTVLIFSGFGWKATFASGLYFKTVLSQGGNLAGLTDSWYSYSWSDSNGNGFVEYYEVNLTPETHGS